MSIKGYWIKDNQNTEFTVTLLKTLRDCVMSDFDKSAFSASYDQINNVAYTGVLPQNATANSTDSVWFNTGNSIDFNTLCFSSKNDTKLYRRTLVIAVPQYTEISSFTTDTLPDNVYLVSDIQAHNKLVLVNSVQYRNDFHRINLNFSKPLVHCLTGTVFDYAEGSDLITDGNVNYQLYPVFLYVVNDQIFITQNEPYSVSAVDCYNTVCGFTDGIPCFDNPDIKLCLGVNPSERVEPVPIQSAYYKNIAESVYGDMLNIYNCSSTVNADIKLSIYSEQDSYERLYLQRGILLNQDCYTACVSQYGFIFINDITNEIYEPAMRDSIVEGYKELVYKPVKFRLLSSNNTDNQTRSVPPIADVQISNEREYYTAGIGVNRRWQVRRYSINDPDNPELIEDLGPANVLTAAYVEAEGTFEYFAGDEHVSLVTEGEPWLVVIRASDKHLYVKRVATDVTTAVLLDTGVEQASVCRGWKSDKYNVDAGLIVAYRKADGVYIKVHHEIAGEMIWNTAQQILDEPVEHVEVKRLNDFRIGIYTTNPNKVILSDRYYIGGTSKTEYLLPKVDYDLLVLSMTQQNGPHDDLAITNIELRNYREFWVQCNYPFVWRDTRWTNEVTITSDPPEGYAIESYRVDDGYFVIRMTKALTSPYTYITFRINAINRIRFKRTDQSIPLCPQLDIIYDNTALGYTTDYINAGISNVNVDLRMKEALVHTYKYSEIFNPTFTVNATLVTKPVGIHNGYHTETVNPQISNVSVTLVVEQSGVTPV